MYYVSVIYICGSNEKTVLCHRLLETDECVIRRFIVESQSENNKIKSNSIFRFNL